MSTCETVTVTAPLSPGVSRRVRIAAHAVPFMTLPSALWRIALLLGLPVMTGVQLRAWEYPYILSLSLVTEGLALLTLGLVRPWGETVPRWVPVLAGRRIPISAVVAAAALGAASLTLIWGYAFLGAFTTEFFDHFGPVQTAVVIVAYMPLVAWGPTLAYVTLAYYRRRRSQVFR